MPAQAIAFVIFEGSQYLFLALFIAGAIDAYILGSLLAPDAPERDLGSQNLVVKSSSEPHKIVYGRTMVGGCVVFLDVLDRYYLVNRGGVDGVARIVEEKTAAQYLNIAIAIAAHDIDGIEEVYFGDELVLRVNSLNGRIEPVTDKYKDYLEFVGYTGNQTAADAFIQANVEKHFNGGTVSDATNQAYYQPQGVTTVTSTNLTIASGLVYPSNTPLKYSFTYTPAGGDHEDKKTKSGTFNGTYPWGKNAATGHPEPADGRPWSASHKLINTSYVYLRLRYHPDLYQGIPQVRTVIRGKRVYDPRYDLLNVVENDTGVWAPSTVYAVNDVVASPTAVKYICIEAHTSFASTWVTDADSDGLSDAFEADFIIAGYWRKVQSNIDPASWEYTDNWALCTRDYLTSGNFHTRSDNKNSLYGIGVKETEIDDNNIIEAANVSNEIVYLKPGTLAVLTESYDATLQQETITVAGDQTDYYVKHEIIEITNAATTWYNVLNAVPSFIIRLIVNILDEAIIEELSRTETFIEESSFDVGTGNTTIKYRATSDRVPTIIRLYSRRFTVNGLVDTSRSPISVLEDLLASGAGKLPFAQGKFLVIPGVYITPTITIGENNLAGPINIKGSLGSANLINGVTGTIKNPANKWEESDFPKQTAAIYLTEDGGYELNQNVQYAFITSNFDAQRLARISLQRSRESVSATLICNMSISEIPIGEFINVNIPRIGWVNKVFSVTSWSYVNSQINIGIREENSLAYDWTDVLLTPITYSPASIFTAVPALDPISALVLASGTAQLRQTADGTIIPRVKITWTAPVQDFGTYLELFIEIDDSISPETKIVKIALVEEELYYLEGVKEGDSVTVRATVRLDDPNLSENEASVQVISGNHIVVGKSQPPADVTSLTSIIKEDLVVLDWVYAAPEIDFKEFEIQEGTTWDAFSGNLLLRSEELDNAAWTLTGTGTITVNAATAPDTTVTADEIDDTDVAVFTHIGQASGEIFDPSSTYVASIFVKKNVVGRATRFAELLIRISGSTVEQHWIDLDTETGEFNLDESVIDAGFTGNVVDYDANYWRIWIKTISQDLGNTAIEVQFYPSVGADLNWAYTVGTTGANVAWGAALGKSAVLDAYTKTVASTIVPTVLINRTNSTQYIVTGHSVDAFKYWVKAIDTSEIESLNAVSTSITVTAPGNIVTLNNRINTDVVNIFWNVATPGTFSIAGYAIREGGANWEAANIVATVNSTDYDIADTWIGDRTYRVKTVDVYGNLSTEITAVVTTTIPGNIVTLNNRVNTDIVNIFWNPAIAGTFSIAGYAIREGGANWDAANIVATVSSTDYNITDTWIGNRTYRVRTIDVYGNLSTEITAVVTTTAPGNIANLFNRINTDVVNIFWNPATPGTFSIVGYVIKEGGANWDAATLLTTVKSTDYDIADTWIGNRTYRVRTIDVYGNLSTEITAVVTTVGPTAVATINNTVLANNINIFWGEVTQGSFSTAGYSIKWTEKLYENTATGGGANTLIDTTSTFIADGFISIDDYLTNVTTGETIQIQSFTEDTITVITNWITPPTNTDVYEVYNGIDWDTAIQLAITKSTDYTVPDVWLGSRTFRIKTLDVYGNLSGETTTPIIITPPANSYPIILSNTIVGNRIEITWNITGNTGTFPVNSYDIRYDSGTGTFAAATPILITSTDAFSRKVDWAGTRRFWVAPIDSVGNYGNGVTASMNITAPGITTIIPQVIDNNVLLRWSDAAGTLPVDYYEVRRGLVYSSATVIGNISSLFTAIFETVSGTFKYWITGVDTAGNFGTNNSILAVVNEPPDYVLLVSANDDFSTVDANWLAGRVFTNSYVNSLGLLTLPVNLTETWATHFTNNSWLTLAAADAAGFPIYVQPTPALAVYEVVYDYGSILNNLSISGTVTNQIIAGDPVLKLTLAASDINAAPTGTNDTLDTLGETLHDTTATFTTTAIVGGIVTNITDGSTGTIESITDNTHLVLSTPGLSGGTDDQWQVTDSYSINNWTSFPQVTASTLKVFASSFRFVRLTVDIVSAAADVDILEISDINLTIDIKEKTESGKGSALATDTGSLYANGTLVTFVKDFVDISSIVVTSNVDSGAANDTIVLYNFEDIPNPTGFRVLLFNSAGTRVNGEFSWVARGY